MFDAISDTSFCTGDMVTMAIDDAGKAHIATLNYNDDWALCGIAARDIEAGEIAQFNPNGNTDDVFTRYGVRE